LRRLPGLTLAVALLGAVACREGAPQQVNVVRADSSGVEIITSTGADTVLPWRFDTIGVLTDSLGELWVFTTVSPDWVLTDRAGRTYVLDREPAVRRFGRDGRYERSIGRQGGAPGEMAFPIGLLQQADSLAVLERDSDLLVRWGPDLDPLNHLRLTGNFENVRKLAFRPGGVWVQRYRYDSTSGVAELFADTNAITPIYSVVEGQQKMMQVCGGRVQFAFPAFFAPTITWRNAGARMLANLGPAYDLRLFEGPRLIASIRRDQPLRAPTVDDLRQLYPEGLKVPMSSGTCTIDLATLMETIGVAETMPAVHGLTLLSDGTMWVQRSVRHQRPVVLDVFGSDGAYAGTVRGYHLPVGLLPNGELLVPIDDEESGGLVIARMGVRK
jgi:hypothetical protein